MSFDNMIEDFYMQFGNHKKMVLSTSYNDKVTSRMMSVVRIDNNFYFQTDKNFRKCEQIQHNPNVSLCIDNIQIEGVCKEIGNPIDHYEFSNLFKQNFKSSYDRYTESKNERLYVIQPIYIQKWIYENGVPYIERFNFTKKSYLKSQYII